MNNTFLDNLDIYYINLESREDRNEYMKDQFLKLGVLNYNRINAYTKDKIIYRPNKNFLDMKLEDFSTTYSHISAIKNFVEYGENDYCLILEDDVDLSNLNKITFSIKDIFLNNKNECIQLSITTREDVFPNFKPHKREYWDFGCIAYAINKEYAKKLVDIYMPNSELRIDNFIPKSYYEYREGVNKLTPPYNENIIYGQGEVLCWPIFSYKMFESSLNNNEEHIRQHIYTDNMFKNYWNIYKEIKINELL